MALDLPPNKLGLTDPADIADAETVGFYLARQKLVRALRPSTRFTAAYVCRIHQLALQHLYDHAGVYRDRKTSKAGFPFPMPMFLPQGMAEWEARFSKPPRGATNLQLLDWTAEAHAELLFLHPFLEGNGRTARLLADLQAMRQGLNLLPFEYLRQEHGLWDAYVSAVQRAASDYEPMRRLFRTPAAAG